MITNNDYKKINNKNIGLYISVGLFILILALNVGLYFYNNSLLSKVESYNKELTVLENNIKEINNDDKIKLYTLIKTNATFLEKYSYLSKIPEFINNLKKLGNIYKVSFKNFSYSNSIINTSVTAIDDGTSFGYQKSQKLISNFRKNEQSKDKNNQIFSLDFIDYFEGQNEIKFNINFKIK